MSMKSIAEAANSLILKSVNEKQSKSNLIFIISQAYYGNRTGMWIEKENVDSLVLGCISRYIQSPTKPSRVIDLLKRKKIDRTIVNIPNSKSVLIYNKFAEERILDEINSDPNEETRHCKPVAEIPELNLKLFSRCIVCGIDKNGEPCSIPEDDDCSFFKYLAY